MGGGASSSKTSNALDYMLEEDNNNNNHSDNSDHDDNNIEIQKNKERRQRVANQGKALIGAMGARQKIIRRAKLQREKRRKALELTSYNRLLLSKTAESEFGDGPKKGDTANIMGLSPPTSPLMGYGRRTFDESISAKKSAIRLKRTSLKGKDKKFDFIAPQVEFVFSDLKNGSNQRKRKRIKTSGEKDTMPMSPLAPVMAYSTSSSIVVRWADNPRDRALINYYELQYAKKRKAMLHWESLASLRHGAKSATIGNLPCFCVPLKFRVRSRSSIGWGPWSPLSEYMQTSPNRPARISQVKAGKVTENTIEIKWGIPDDNGSKILYYTLYACKEEGGSFVNAYRGEKNKFKLGTEPKKKSGKKSFANKFKDKKNGSETDSDDDDGEEKSVPVIVEPGVNYLVKIIATNKIGDSVSSELASFQSCKKGEVKTDKAAEKDAKNNKTSETKDEKNDSNNNNKETAEAIMSSWLHHSRQVQQQQHEQQQEREHPQSQSSSWESKWQEDMPTGPTRIAQLSNGWVECWDPASERIYYHNPATNHTQWEYPSESIHDDHIHSGTNSRAGKKTQERKKRGGPALPDKDAPFRQKRFRFLWHVRGKPNIKCKMLPVQVSRDNLVYKSFQALAHVSAVNFKKKLRITYDGEVGIDSGGITKDWFLEMSRALLDPRYVLFQKGETNGRFTIDSRSGVNDQHLEYFHFFGRLIGKAIYDRHLLDVHLNPILYKHLLGIAPTMDDLKEMDPVYCDSLQWVMNNSIDGVDVLENFSVVRQEFGESVEVELIPNGKNIAVTDKNKRAYVEALVAWECGKAFEKQINAIRNGFFDIIPEEAVKVFNVKELELLINGKEDIDVDDMQSGSVYNGGYDLDSKPIALFWEAMKEWTIKERGEVLRFVTGTSRVPLDGFDPVFTITKASEGGKNALPSAHTCFNQLVLPEYENLKQLQEKMKFAIAEGSVGFHLT